jgi:hypothetical protein
MNAPPPLRVSVRYPEGVVLGYGHDLAPQPADKSFHRRAYVAAAGDDQGFRQRSSRDKDVVRLRHDITTGLGGRFIQHNSHES